MLELSDIQYAHRSGQSHFRLSIPSLIFKAGVVNAILGKNGSGKTTLLNIIGGHILCDSGNVCLQGEDITKRPPAQRKVSTVFQTIALFPHLTVRENILIAIRPNSFGRVNELVKNKIDTILDNFSLVEYAGRKPDRLSVGQQQRVAIARAMSNEPTVLLLDEPTSALDFENISYLKKMLKDLVRKGSVPVCVLVSHDLHFVLDVADEIKYIEDGALVFEGGSNDFRSSEYFVI